jgi:hypothetical protein
MFTILIVPKTPWNSITTTSDDSKCICDQVSVGSDVFTNVAARGLVDFGPCPVGYTTLQWEFALVTFPGPTYGSCSTAKWYCLPITCNNSC